MYTKSNQLTYYVIVTHLKIDRICHLIILILSTDSDTHSRSHSHTDIESDTH